MSGCGGLRASMRASRHPSNSPAKEQVILAARILLMSAVQYNSAFISLLRLRLASVRCRCGERVDTSASAVSGV